MKQEIKVEEFKGYLEDGSYQIVFQKYKNVWSQSPPYLQNTPARWVIRQWIRGSAGALTHPLIDSGANPLRDQVTNLARKRFVDKLGDASQIGSTITSERKASLKTITDAVVNLTLAANAVRRGQLVKAAGYLGFNPPVRERIRRTKNHHDFEFITEHRAVYDKKGNVISYKEVKRKRWKGPPVKTVVTEVWVMPSGKEIVKSLGNKWLWFSYGIKPLVSDIYNAAEVFTRPLPTVRIRGSASEKTQSITNFTNQWGDSYFIIMEYKYLVTVAADVRVRDSDMFLANQLGLVNPVQMFNEGIPFSFVIDWFSNLSDWIGQMTDLVGLDVLNPVTSSKHVGRYTDLSPVRNRPAKNDITEDREYNRVLSIPSVKLRFAYERFQWQRGLNAISLLVQALNTR